MKYSICKLESGKYAVKASKNRYYESTVRDTKEEAQEQALIKSVTYYHVQSKQAYYKLVKLFPDQYSKDYECATDEKTNYGDLLA